MIKAKITSKVGTSLEWELPANIHELHHALVEMGIRKAPRSILLMDDNAADVELTADSEIGSRLLRVFSKGDTLADANTVAFAVSTAREEILTELEQNIIHNQYLTKEMSGSVSRSKNDPSQSLQMIERPLMTPDELKSMPKGQFIVMKTGFYPMKVRLKLYFDWGIQFDEQYAVSENGNRKVAYAEKNELLQAIILKYHPDWLKEDDTPPEEPPASGPEQGAPSQKQHKRSSQKKRPDSGKGKPFKTVAPHNRGPEVVQDGPV